MGSVQLVVARVEKDPLLAVNYAGRGDKTVSEVF